MKYKVVIRFKDKDGNIKEEFVLLSAQSARDAELQRHINEEVAIKRHGGANVISVELVEE
jgi:hypothetical protein